MNGKQAIQILASGSVSCIRPSSISSFISLNSLLCINFQISGTHHHYHHRHHHSH